jgi:CIC family chloride channel protein
VNQLIVSSHKLMKGQQRLILDTILMGVVGALSARVFMFLLGLAHRLFLVQLAGYHLPGLPEEGGVLRQVIGPHGLWLIPLATTLGGLLTGFLVYSLAPEAEGDGTDGTVKVFHHLGGFIQARVPVVKTIASAITIGSGGASGREGPISQIAAGVGSVYATLTHRSDEERRFLVLIGMAAGLSAIFRSPIGTAIFAVEVLYSDMEFDAPALLFTLLGSVVAYAVNGLIVGWQPLFQVPAGLGVPGFSEYLWYGALGVVSGVVAAMVPMVFYTVRDGFHALPIPSHVKPALGGLGVGLLALALPQVLSGGYGWIQEAINGRLATNLLLILVFAKMIAFALTLSSGGSGGVFAPSLFVGAMLGGFLAQLSHQPAAPFVVVGMAAVFGGAARVPIAAMLMVTEMTGGYNLLVAAGLAVMLSYIVQVAITGPLKYKSLYEQQVPRRADSPAHHLEHVEAAIHLLANHHISVPETVSHLDLRALLASGIALDLPDGKRLALGVLKKKSPYVGKSVQENFPVADQEDLEIVAVFREGHTLLPHSDLVLKPEDRLLVIAKEEVWKRLESHLAAQEV